MAEAKLRPDTSLETEVSILKEENRQLKLALKKANAEALTVESVRRQILELKTETSNAALPRWLADIPAKGFHSPGVPSLLVSDLHWGEKIISGQVAGKNSYNLETAHARMQTLTARTIDLLENHVVNPEYPGIVIPLAGDMVSGDIHDELRITNEMPIMPVVVDLFGVMKMMLKTFADKFGHVFVPAVVGNHGRCLEEYTDVLTKEGWVSGRDITTNHLVASVNLDNNEITYSHPLNITYFSEKGGWKLSSTLHEEVVSYDHSTILDGKRAEIKTLQTLTRQGRFMYAANLPATPDKYDKDFLQLLMWTYCDGAIVDRSRWDDGHSFRLQFKISVPEKLDALKQLLRRSHVPFTEKLCKKGGVNKLQPYYIRIYGDCARKVAEEMLIDNKKCLPLWFTELNRSETEAVLSVIPETDGRMRGDTIEWGCSDQKAIDIIQHMCVINSIPVYSRKKNVKGGFKNSGINSVVRIYPSNLPEKTRSHVVEKEELFEKMNFVGIQTEHGTLITRRNGKICVTGNSTIKPTHKNRAYTNYDWLLYSLLEKHFEGDKRFTFLISEGSDCRFNIFNHRYLLTHGDQFKGGSGQIGALGPVIRGDLKKRSRNVEMGLEYDTIIMGHWHQFTLLRRVIINGSLKGVDEYAFNGNFPFEPPAQALWLTHPVHGITISMPVLVEKEPKTKVISWVSIPKK